MYKSLLTYSIHIIQVLALGWRYLSLPLLKECEALNVHLLALIICSVLFRKHFLQKTAQPTSLLALGLCLNATFLVRPTWITLFKSIALPSSISNPLWSAQFCRYSFLYTYHLLSCFVIYLLVFTVFCLSSPLPLLLS